MFSKKPSKIEKIFTVNLTLCGKCQINGDDFVNFCGLLRKHELYTEYGPIKNIRIFPLVRLYVTGPLNFSQKHKLL